MSGRRLAYQARRRPVRRLAYQARLNLAPCAGVCYWTSNPGHACSQQLQNSIPPPWQSGGLRDGTGSDSQIATAVEGGMRWALVIVVMIVGRDALVAPAKSWADHNLTSLCILAQGF